MFSSVEPEPFRVTVVPSAAVCGDPASATGGWFVLVTVMFTVFELVAPASSSTVN